MPFTKGKLSESERANRLLRFALDQDIARFFAAAPPDQDERRAFQSAAIAPWGETDVRHMS